MGLFDDILKKPVTAPIPPADPLGGAGGMGGQQGGSPGGVSPFIVKSEPEMVIGNNIASSPGDIEPIPASVHAEEDTSSVLSPSDTIASEYSPVTPVSPVAPGVMMTETNFTRPEKPVIEINQMGINTPNMVSTQAETAYPSPTPVITTQNTFTQNSMTPQSTQPVESLNIPQSPSLFDSLLKDESTQVPTAATSFGGAPFDGFGGGQAGMNLGGGSSGTYGQSGGQQDDTSTQTQGGGAQGVQDQFHTPREFIEKSLASIAVMVDNINVRHDAKIAEAEGYRKEKMRFAELEKGAYAEAAIMDKEKDHALRMEKIFKAELAADEANKQGGNPENHDDHKTERHTSHRKHHSTAENEITQS